MSVIGAAVLPLVANAQRAERMRRIGVPMPFAKDNPEAQARIAAFLQELQQLGWFTDRNLQVGRGALTSTTGFDPFVLH